MILKILFIRFSSIGDIVLTTPVIRNAKQQFNGGNVEIHYLSKEKYSIILNTNPYIDVLHLIKDKVNPIIESLKNENFDYIFDLHNNLRTAQVKRALKGIDFTFKKYNIQKWILVNLKINRMPNMHLVDRYMETTRSFGIVNDGKGLDYFIPEKDFINVNESPIAIHKAYIAFAIGGQHIGKKLPNHKIISICNKLNKPIILLGDIEDKINGDVIANESTQLIFNAAGRYNLNQSASMIKQAVAVITHDTGLMHIAAALKKPIISIWGATVPAFGMYPYMPVQGSRWIEPNSGGRPYSKLGNTQWYKSPYKGMETIDIDQVINAIAKCE